MAKTEKYRFNNETLSYEVAKSSRRARILRIAGLFAASIVLSLFYFWLYTYVFGLELPKTAMLKKENAAWCSKVEVLNSNMDRYDQVLTELQMRDDDIYRSVFGMNEVPAETRNVVVDSTGRYAHLDEVGAGQILKSAVMRLDVLTRRSVVQSESFAEISELSRQAGDMASCIPAIPPIVPDKAVYFLSSQFGYRTDPFTQESKLHTGVDLALPSGNYIFATGAGVVERVRHDLDGYGNSVMIDHGFGYKTRYAHMESISVTEGMRLKRGDCIGKSGSSGRSSGPHLHYEVIYRGDYVNPANYFDLNITPEEYYTMVQDVSGASSR